MSAAGGQVCLVDCHFARIQTMHTLMPVWQECSAVSKLLAYVVEYSTYLFGLCMSEFSIP